MFPRYIRTFNPYIRIKVLILISFFKLAIYQYELTGYPHTPIHIKIRKTVQKLYRKQTISGVLFGKVYSFHLF